MLNNSAYLNSIMEKIKPGTLCEVEYHGEDLENVKKGQNPPHIFKVFVEDSETA